VTGLDRGGEAEGSYEGLLPPGMGPTHYGTEWPTGATVVAPSGPFRALHHETVGFPIHLGGYRIRGAMHLLGALRYEDPALQWIVLDAVEPLTLPGTVRPQSVRHDWARVRVDVLWWILQVRLYQHPRFRARLLDAAGPIVYRSHDRLWGAELLGGCFRGQNVSGQLLGSLRNRFVGARMPRVLPPPSFPRAVLLGAPLPPVRWVDPPESGVPMWPIQGGEVAPSKFPTLSPDEVLDGRSDRPRVFTFRDARGLDHLAYRAASDGDHDRFLVVPVEPARVDALKKSTIDLREALSGSPFWIVDSTTSGERRVWESALDYVPDEGLPKAGTGLWNLPD